MNPSTLRLVQSITADEVVITFFTSVGFIVVYTVFARWWRSALGRNMVAFDAALSLTLLPSVIHHITGTSSVESAGFAWFNVAALAAVPCVIVWRTVIVIRAQLNRRKPDDAV